MWLSYFQTASLAFEYTETPAFGRTPLMSRGQVARELERLNTKLDVNKKLAAYKHCASRYGDAKSQERRLLSSSASSR